MAGGAPGAGWMLGGGGGRSVGGKTRTECPRTQGGVRVEWNFNGGALVCEGA
jgi:hypothetical protein